MSLSRLLLVASSSKKQIRGQGKDKIIIKPLNPNYDGEVVLCFELDDDKARERKVCQSLGMKETDKRCDGIIFYAKDDQDGTVICFVEMKSTNIDDAAVQIQSTRTHIERLLRADCGTDCNRQFQHIHWKACFYHHGATPDKISRIKKQLGTAGFGDVYDFTSANNDIGPFLRGETNAKGLAKKVRNRR